MDTMLNQNKNVDDSTSSEDETIKNVLKEATDHEFLKDIYFSAKKPDDSGISQKTNGQNNSKHSQETKPKSLRPDLEEKERFENFGVTATFQKYVAKKLDEIIEKSIKIKNKHHNSLTTDTESTDNNSGIKLLSSSVEFVTAEEQQEKLPQKRKIKVSIDEDAVMLKCREVAVDPEKILSKSGTKAWTSKRGEPEFKYKKLKNGTLVEQT
ncbi:uncharacterized protein LOC143215706 [Lasioglossum baleicum]|uniref:uncharacterized protein LOC143215706 n=1 Tax=Lasioglossum baleicum TaxID=434251 RepID=UPI003FCD9865